MTVISQTKPKARKNHRCLWCSETIHKGHVYDKGVNVYDGQIYTWKNHLFCMEIAQKLSMWDWVDEGVSEDDFREEIKEEYRKLVTLHPNNPFDSDEYVMPDFKGQLIFVLNAHGITHTLA